MDTWQNPIHIVECLFLILPAMLLLFLYYTCQDKYCPRVKSSPQGQWKGGKLYKCRQWITLDAMPMLFRGPPSECGGEAFQWNMSDLLWKYRRIVSFFVNIINAWGFLVNWKKL